MGGEGKKEDMEVLGQGFGFGFGGIRRRGGGYGEGYGGVRRGVDMGWMIRRSVWRS